MILQQDETYETQFIVSRGPGLPKHKLPIFITKRGTRLWLKYPFSKALTEELKKCLTGMKWHGYDDKPIKQWSCKDCFHNWFQFEFLEGSNPYANWDKALYKIPYTESEDGLYLLTRSGRKAYQHQYDMICTALTFKKAIIAGEMGVGKTFATMEVMEASGVTDWLWVGPKSALYSVKLEFEKWKSFIKPTFVTYSALSKYCENWEKGRPVHQGIVFDESAKIKTPETQRSEAAMHLADNNRREWGDDGYILLLSGAPAPKSPLDWYNQCETAQPGFICEGSIRTFKNRIAIIEQRENQVTGGVYPELIAWRDTDKKCHICGRAKDHINHDSVNNIQFHGFEPCVNEVANLYKRMRGLVLVKSKKDCLQLPEKIYRDIRCEPSKEIVRAAKLIVKKAPSAIKAITLLRELSDGFQYIEEEVGKQVCELCHGARTVMQKVYHGPEKTYDFLVQLGEIVEGSEWTDEELLCIQIDPAKYPHYYKDEVDACPHCKGLGETPTYARSYKEFPCPKDDIVSDLLDEYDDVGRLVLFGGFTATIDRITKIVSRRKWEYIKVDGRGYFSSFADKPEDMLKAFQSGLETYPRMCFIGNPEACGTGLTLTASPAAYYYSNTFNADARIQSEDRIHRIGMDVNRGATIGDIFHLGTDEYVFNNLKKKRELQSITLGQLEEALNVD